MDHIFKGLPFVRVYLDDILIVSKTEREHLNQIKAVFDRLKEYNIKLRLDKCKFFQTNSNIWDISLIEKDLNLMQNMSKSNQLKEPTSKKEIERFLGILKVRWFIPN